MLSMNLKDPVYIPVIMMSLGRMEDNRMQKAFFLLVCLVLAACVTNEDNQSAITQEEIKFSNQFIGKWSLNEVNGQTADKFVKKLAFGIAEDQLRTEFNDVFIAKFTLQIIEQNWDQCCSIDFDSWITFNEDGTYKSYMKIDFETDLEEILGNEIRLILGRDLPEEDFGGVLEEMETGIYDVTETDYKIIPDSMAERILGVSRTKPEEGYWKIDGNFLTLNHTKEDKEIDSIIYSKNQ